MGFLKVEKEHYRGALVEFTLCHLEGVDSSFVYGIHKRRSSKVIFKRC